METVQSHEEFSKKLSGGVILMEPDKQSGEADYREKRQNELVKAALLPTIVIAISTVWALHSFFRFRPFTIAR
jgi:hypothetical protein